MPPINATKLTVLRTIQQILGQIEQGIRADHALQTTLSRERVLGPEEKRDVNQGIQALFRWQGWLEPGKSLSSRLQAALELDARFASDPASFTDAELLERALPDWIWQFLEKDPAIARALQAKPKLWLRARPGRARDLAERLDAASPHPDLPDALEYHGHTDLFRTPEFHAGEFEIQDVNSQRVGLLCAPKPGQTWWDACAGEGGKTLHLCDQMQNKGLVWASDKAEWRLKNLARRASRARLFNYRAKVWVNLDRPAVKGPFDGVLVDAPCSGVGTWSRNPQAKWTLRPQDIEELALLQRKLLETAATTLKPGARLIYSVCTLTPPETTQVIEHLLSSRPELKLIETHLFHPFQTGGIGMFAAILSRR